MFYRSDFRVKDFEDKDMNEISTQTIAQKLIQINTHAVFSQDIREAVGIFARRLADLVSRRQSITPPIFVTACQSAFEEVREGHTVGGGDTAPNLMQADASTLAAIQQLYAQIAQAVCPPDFAAEVGIILGQEIRATLVDIRAKLELLETFIIRLDGGEFLPDEGDDPIGAMVRLNRENDGFDVSFKSDGTATLIVYSGLEGLEDQAGSWRYIFEYLLTLVDAVTRTSTAGQEGWKTRLMAELKQFAATL